MADNSWEIANTDVTGVTMAVPEGHRHLRTTLHLRDGRSLTFQEATIANIVRAYTTVKTHPATTRLALTGRQVPARKAGFAEWQLLEE